MNYRTVGFSINHKGQLCLMLIYRKAKTEINMPIIGFNSINEVISFNDSLFLLS